jgi:hypothetical protein
VPHRGVELLLPLHEAIAVAITIAANSPLLIVDLMS